MQDLSKFRVPDGFRGRSKIGVQLWWLVQATLFRWSPQVLYKFRSWLLRIFGARIGRNVLVRPTVRITYPWKLSIGDYSWIGDDVVLYSLGFISIGNHSVVSQKCYLCAGDHDYHDEAFPIRARPISVGSRSWLAADTFVGPGVTIGDDVVVGARCSVFQDIVPNSVVVGTPARRVKDRF
ncbi:putative colanic acid biosynthesis acetyltransferase [Pseudacidovorax intermedius]|uniref:putative colanic acid biosynthesis acetyltransferase n=1 Tax=Pseudacidovorax intermedius TaxID=433924 RepID=UPI0006939DBE|nr:putative colanic acid biosynthesis acetyltransferase [Pseudacidovorax intermedius]